MTKSNEKRIEEIERKMNPEEDVLVTYWEGEDFVTFCLPLSMQGVKMPVEEYRQKYAGVKEIVVRYEDVEPNSTCLNFRWEEES